MAKYRQRFDILADVVRVASSGARKTKIMYFANLSYVLLNKYLEDALLLRFLRFNGTEYLVTRKGEAFLKRYIEFSGRYSSVRADLEELKSEAAKLQRMCSLPHVKIRNMRRRTLVALG